MEQKKEVDIRCEICKSNQTYYRTKTKDRKCKICGHIKKEEAQ